MYGEAEELVTSQLEMTAIQSKAKVKHPLTERQRRTRTLTRTKGPTKGIHFLKSLIGSLEIIDC